MHPFNNPAVKAYIDGRIKKLEQDRLLFEDLLATFRQLSERNYPVDGHIADYLEVVDAIKNRIADLKEQKEAV